jgi:hypothetical protein
MLFGNYWIIGIIGIGFKIGKLLLRIGCTGLMSNGGKINYWFCSRIFWLKLFSMGFG